MLLEKVEQSGRWPQQACTTMFFLIPKNVTSERPIALMRAQEVATWQQKYRVDWDVTDGRNGGNQRKVLEVLMEMERFNGRAKAEDRGAVALVLDLTKAFEQVSLPVVSSEEGRSYDCYSVILGTRGECSSKDMRRNRCRPSRPFCQGQSGVACFCALCCRTL